MVGADIVDVAWVSIYILGVVLIPVLAGVAMRSEDIKGSDFFWDFCVPIGLISLFWPFVLVMAGVIAAVIVVVMVPGFVFRSLMKIGQLIGRNMGRKKKKIDRREDEEREHARRVLNAKPGDKEYFDYVCD